MKTNWLVGSVILAGAMVLRAQTNDLSAALRQGLFEEEANRNLDAAISNYQALATQFDRDRQIAATAIFRLGECYRKLGQTNDAVIQYQRIIREFSDQQTLATLSQQNLTGLGTTPQASSASATTSESTAKTTELEAEAAALKAQIARLSSLSGANRRTTIQQNFPNPVLTTLMQQLNEAEQNLASLTNDYAPTDLHVARVTALVNAINGQIDTQVEGVIKGLQAKMEADLSAAKALHDQSGPVQAVHTEASTVTDDEDQEIRRIQQLIQDSPDLINAPASDGFTPLGNAARNGQIKVATFLLDHGAGINVAQRAGATALHDAARAGNRAMVELLLSRGAEVNATDDNGRTPLYLAVGKGFQAVTEVLLANKADVNASDKIAGNTQAGKTPLHLAADGGEVKIIQVLLAAGANPNTENNQGWTPLSFAAQSGSLEAVKMLLKAKADPNGGRLDTPLFCAIRRGNTNTVELLLRAGANPNQTGNVDWQIPGRDFGSPQGGTFSPLRFAILQNEPEVVSLLLRFKANPNANDGWGGQPLIFAALSHLDILKALLDAGADPNRPDRIQPNNIAEQGESPLMSVVGSSFYETADGNLAAAKLLIAHGANPNFKNRDGKTALHWAVSVGNLELVRLLLDNKADPNAEDNNGITPLAVAKADQNNGAGRTVAGPLRSATGADIAALLRSHGALDNLPHWNRITASRPSANYSEAVFRKGTNDWNQISLFDVLGVQYELISNSQSEPQRVNAAPYSYNAGNNSLPFPDLANIIIRRATADGKGWENRTIDLASALNSGNCAVDLQLRWGDVVEIPEKDHVLNERWPGLSTNELFTLKNCLTRHLQISVKGQSTNIVITPQVRELVPGSWEYPLSSYGAKMEPAVSLLKFEPFMLWPVLKDSKLLLASSDLSHIKVKRRDTTTGKMHEWIVDCSNPQAPPNLWLRDGDVIEVPEK